MWSAKLIALVLYLGLIFNAVDCRYSVPTIDIDEEDRIIASKYMEMDKELKDLMNAGVKRALPMLMEASQNLNLSSKCMSNILQLTSGIRKLKLSAIRFLDASGKPSPAFLDGNMHMLGDYGQCLNSTVLQRNGEVAFRGQYCLLHYTPLLPKKKRPVTFDGGIEEVVELTKNASEVVRFIISKAQLFYYNPSKFGVCVPSGCSEGDIRQIAKYMGAKLHFSANVVYCDTDEEEFVQGGKIVYIILFVMLGVLALIGSILEYTARIRKVNLKNSLSKTLLCFSVLRNFPRVISTEIPDNTIACLNGIRALNLFYIILLHQYYAVVKYFITSHVTRSLSEIPQFFMQIVTNGFLTADVFFFMGGLLNCYTRMKMKDTNKGKTNVFLIIYHRLNRIGPAYLFFCFMMSLYRPFGPMRVFEKNEYVEKCEKYWWQNALFINNFFFQDNTCAPHSWYVAADMQLFLLSLFTVPFFFKSPRKGIIINSAMIMSGILFTIIWSWITDLTPSIVLYRPNEEEINKSWNAHTYTFPHIAPYFAGILFGYVLAVKEKIKIPSMYQVIGWPVAIFLFISMLFLTQLWNSGGSFTPAESSLYFAFSKFVFVIPIAWMILCCITGNGGIINYILTLPLWVPISKISFVVYLIAPFLQTFYFANSRTIVDGHRMSLIWRYAGDITISSALGLVMVVLIEYPFKNVEKYLLATFSSKKEEETPPKIDTITEKAFEDKNINKCEMALDPKNIFSFK